MSAEPDHADAGVPRVPPGVVAGARAAFTAVDRSAVTAELVSDSLDGAAAASGPRTVVFAGDGVQVRVVLPEPGSGDEVLVVVEPAELEALEVHVRGGEPATATRAPGGSWTVRPVPRGPVSLGLRRADEPVLRTAWTRF